MARVALAQINSVLGEVGTNLTKARTQVEAAAADGADLVVFPELALQGYELGRLDDDYSLAATDPRLDALGGTTTDVLVGFHEDGGIRRYNSALYLAADGTRHVHRKLYLPNYLVSEERKHAMPGQSLRAFDTRIGRVAVLICYDAWQPVLPWLAAQDGAEVLLIPATSAVGRWPTLDVVDYWHDVLRLTARMQQCWTIFCNRVGTEEGDRYWGGSCILDPDGEVVAQAPMWDPALLTADIDVSVARRRRHQVPLMAEARLGMLSRELNRLIDEGGDA